MHNHQAHQMTANDRATSLCLWLGGGVAHGGHWLFLAGKARHQRQQRQIAAAEREAGPHPAWPRVAQIVKEHGDEVAVFVEPPPPEVGCGLCGLVIADSPVGVAGIYGGTTGCSHEGCSHVYCRVCLEAELHSTWGCPGCGDPQLVAETKYWTNDTRWKGLEQIVEDLPEIAAQIAELRVHCRHGLRSRPKPPTKADKEAERKRKERLNKLGPFRRAQARKQMRLAEKYRAEAAAAAAAVVPEEDWLPDEDGCGAVLTLGGRDDHQDCCFAAQRGGYERACLQVWRRPPRPILYPCWIQADPRGYPNV
jgi:hypothetical protein